LQIQIGAGEDAQIEARQAEGVSLSMRLRLAAQNDVPIQVGIC
jgi:hypothetical protein